MCILSVRQWIEVHYDEMLFEKCIMSKSTVDMGKIAINSSASGGMGIEHRLEQVESGAKLAPTALQAPDCSWVTTHQCLLPPSSRLLMFLVVRGVDCGDRMRLPPSLAVWGLSPRVWGSQGGSWFFSILAFLNYYLRNKSGQHFFLRFDPFPNPIDAAYKGVTPVPLSSEVYQQFV
jgi:hypothetical protein